MHNALPLSLAVLVSVGIIVIGCFYLASPQRIERNPGRHTFAALLKANEDREPAP
jgi:hypothetical protein